MTPSITTAIRKLSSLTTRTRIVQGGTSAGKTYGILLLLTDICTKRRMEVSVCSESMPHLRKGAMKDFLSILEKTGRYEERRWNRTTSVYRFHNGSSIEFFGVESEAKVRGLRRDILYVNEANGIPFETFHQLSIRTNSIVILDFNPTQSFWAHEEFPPDKEDGSYKWLILTASDNEALSPSIRAELEGKKASAYRDPALSPPELFEGHNVIDRYWDNWCRVYLYGLTGSLEGMVYPSFTQRYEIPPSARFLGYGMDFGYSQDPTAVVSLHQDLDGTCYWEERLYHTGLTNSQLSAAMSQVGIRKSQPIVADCAEPKSIAELKRWGWNVIPCSKGSDSIVFGIDLIKSFPMVVSGSSAALVRELRLYHWEDDGKPSGKDNHLMDAMRYIAVRTLGRRSKAVVQPVTVHRPQTLFMQTI